MNKIKITKDIKICKSDLEKEVDRSQEFTLMDVIRMCVNSEIGVDKISKIIRCPYILEYWQEAQKKNKIDSEIDYLELYLGESTDNEIDKTVPKWWFHGIGKKGHVPSDIIEYGKMSRKDMKNYRERYAIEYSPINTIAHHRISIADKNCPITLVELVHAIFWELSFCGSPKKRDAMIAEIRRRASNIKKSKYISTEEVKKKVLQKINGIRKSKED